MFEYFIEFLRSNPVGLLGTVLGLGYLVGKIKITEPNTNYKYINDVCTIFAQYATDAAGVDAIVDPSSEWILVNDDGDGASAPASDINPKKSLVTEEEQADPVYIANHHGFVVDMLVYEKPSA